MNAMLKAIAATAIAFTLTGAAYAEEINFGIISTESQQNLKPKWEPFLADMKKETGLDVKPFFASDYAGVIEGMRFGKVQMAWYGNKSAMEAVDRADGEIFAQTVSVDGNPGYWSLILAPKDSKLNTVEDLLKCDKTLNFGLGDPNSTSGYLVPTTFVFAANKVDPKNCFKAVTNANHETNAMAVANGQLDAAANNTENMALIEKNQPAAFAKIKVIWNAVVDDILSAGTPPVATGVRLRDTGSGAVSAVSPSGSPQIARIWFSNCEVTAPSIVQCPELWTRGAISLNTGPSAVAKYSAVSTPTCPSVSAIRPVSAAASVHCAAISAGAGKVERARMPSSCTFHGGG